MHSLAPAGEYLASSPHLVRSLPPPHEYPTGHNVHEVRDTVEPPDVYEPLGQVSHLLAPFPAYMLSALQPVQRLLEASLNEPPLQRVTRLDPSHWDPAGQPEHDVRVFLVLADVNEPGVQRSHFVALLPEE